MEEMLLLTNTKLLSTLLCSLTAAFPTSVPLYCQDVVTALLGLRSLPVICFGLTVSTQLLWELPCGSQPPAPVFNRCDGTPGLILAVIKNTQCQAPVTAPASWWSLLCLCTPSVSSLITGPKRAIFAGSPFLVAALMAGVSDGATGEG